LNPVVKANVFHSRYLSGNHFFSLTVTFFFLLTAALLMYYGLQHYLSMAGSLIFIPLIIVPAMGGTDVSIVSHGYHAVFYNTGQELA